MRLILTILLIGLFKADAQMVINASAPYRPLGITPILDAYSNASYAYSLRKLRTAYTGAAIRVRKDTTGQPEQDIGFVNNELDTAALKSFLNARNGFVVTWYDQSGNARNVTQATQAEQPRIANLGVIDRRSGDIAIVFDGSNDLLRNNVTGYQVNNVSHYAVSSRGNSANTFRTVYSTGILTSPETGFGIFYSATSAPLTQDRLYQQAQTDVAGSSINIGDYVNTLNTNNLFFGITTSSIDYSYYNGGDEKTASHTRANTLTDNRTLIGSRLNNALLTPSNYLNGTVSELVFWQSNQSANRTAIQNNINTYYSIY